MKPDYVYVDHDLSAAALRQGRQQLGLLQQDVAAQLQMSAATYSACESGKRRFPLARIGMLPPKMVPPLRDAFIREFAAEIDRKLAEPVKWSEPKAADPELVAKQMRSRALTRKMWSKAKHTKEKKGKKGVNG